MKQRKLSETIGHDILEGTVKFKLELTDYEKHVLESSKLRIIAIEGVDKTGKTTFLDQLIKIREIFSDKNFEDHSPEELRVHERYENCEIRRWGRFTLVYFPYYQRSECFIKSGIHRRIIRSANKALLDKNPEPISKKSSPYYRAMFDLFYADYISTLKKLVRIIKNCRVQTAIFDRSWISNYAYNNRGVRLDFIPLKKWLGKDGYYKMKIDMVYAFSRWRLKELYPSIKYSTDDFYEKSLLKDINLLSLEDSFLRIYLYLINKTNTKVCQPNFASLKDLNIPYYGLFQQLVFFDELLHDFILFYPNRTYEFSPYYRLIRKYDEKMRLAN